MVVVVVMLVEFRWLRVERKKKFCCEWMREKKCGKRKRAQGLLILGCKCKWVSAANWAPLLMV